MERIEIGDFLLIAESHTAIAAERLARMDRVLVLAQSALAAPFAGFGDVELFPDLHAKAAIRAGVPARVLAHRKRHMAPRAPFGRETDAI